jgi:peptide/nickel transport system substrate-binding protein
MKFHRRIPLSLLGIGLAILLTSAACNYPGPSLATPALPNLETRTPQDTPTANSLAQKTSTQAPPRVLSICLGEEPASLFPYGDSSLAARSVRQAIYDGPVDLVDYAMHPVILETAPNLANGDARLEPVEARPGDRIVDASGNLNTLREGVDFLPTGCQNTSCALKYTGAEPVTLDQLAVRFRLREGLLWSDGTPLTAADSAYAYAVASELYPRVRGELIRHTDSYTVIDERSIEWRGIPGYRDPQYAANFFAPFPRHAWEGIPTAELAGAQASGKLPLGWGAYAVEEWLPGDHITLRKNSSYFRAGEGLPRFDRLVYRFTGSSEAALSALQAGECDLVDESALQNVDLEALRQLEEAGRVKAAWVVDAAWEHLDFGIQPLDPAMPAFFQAKEVRRAAAQCLDREKLLSLISIGPAQVLDAYVPADHPLANPDAAAPAYNPQEATAALQSAGWIDADNDPATPRLAQGAAGVADGTPFQVELLTIRTPEREQVAAWLKESLAQCGIGVDLRFLEPEELFSAGEEAPVFGRRFHLVLFGWQAAFEPPCELYTSAEIPGPFPEHPKGWSGANPSGFHSEAYDQACLLARTALPDDPQHAEAHRRAQEIFTAEMPALPLYTRSRLVVTRPDLCGLVTDPLAESSLWNLEGLDYGSACPAE